MCIGTKANCVKNPDTHFPFRSIPSHPCGGKWLIWIRNNGKGTTRKGLILISKGKGLQPNIPNAGGWSRVMRNHGLIVCDVHAYLALVLLCRDVPRYNDDVREHCN